MEEAIRNFHKQFDFTPELVNGDNLKKRDKYIVSGMGGSHLGAWLLKCHNPFIDLLIHRDYGLPRVPDYFLYDSLLILCSYSGNTEEVLDCAQKALEKGLSLAVVTGGGELLEFAKQHSVPYIELPNMNVEPRMAVPLFMLALARLMDNASLEADIKTAGCDVQPLSIKEEGERIASILEGKMPIIYSSTVNVPIAYNWKIKCNETAKVPASFNVVPELCHNELSGFDNESFMKDGASNMVVLMLHDAQDHPRIHKRMNLLEKLFEEKQLSVVTLSLVGETVLHKIFHSILLAEWVALTLAKYYGVPDAKTPLIASFKAAIKN